MGVMKKKWIWYLGFFVLLFVVYLAVVFSQNDFSQYQLPAISQVQPFSFVNQNGQTISDRELDGKVYVTEYFFTTCRGICPRMNANMRRVYDEYKNRDGFAILSHTCMPETDSVPQLKQYEAKMILGTLKKNGSGEYEVQYDTAQHLQVQNNNLWQFVTGDKQDLYKMARSSYLIDNNKSDTTAAIANQFIHTQFFALVDKQSRVRGIYDGLKEDEIQKLLTDINGLLREKKQTRSMKGF